MEDHIHKISKFITDDPDVINEGWEELGIEDPDFDEPEELQLTPEEEAEVYRRSLHVQDADGSWKPRVRMFEPKGKEDLELHQEYEEIFDGDGCFCSSCGGAPGVLGDTLLNFKDKKQIREYMEEMAERVKRIRERFLDDKSNRAQFDNLLDTNQEIGNMFRSIKRVINDYGLGMGLDETESYRGNLYLHYHISGLNAIGNHVDGLFELRIKIVDNKLLAEAFSYWVDGGETWDPFDLSDESETARAASFMREKGYDVNYKKYGHPILDSLSFHCRLLPQLQTEVGLSKEEITKLRASKHRELSQKEEYGYYKVTGDIEIGPGDVHYSKDLWVEAMSAQHALEKSGMTNAKVTGYMPPKPL